MLKDDKYITIVGAISGIFGGIRFIWAPICERYSYKKVFGVFLYLNTIIGFNFIYIVEYKPLFMIYVCMAFWFAGGQFAMFPVIMAKLFGD